MAYAGRNQHGLTGGHGMQDAVEFKLTGPFEKIIYLDMVTMVVGAGVDADLDGVETAQLIPGCHQAALGPAAGTRHRSDRSEIGEDRSGWNGGHDGAASMARR